MEETKPRGHRSHRFENDGNKERRNDIEIELENSIPNAPVPEDFEFSAPESSSRLSKDETSDQEEPLSNDPSYDAICVNNENSIGSYTESTESEMLGQSDGTIANQNITATNGYTQVQEEKEDSCTECSSIVEEATAPLLRSFSDCLVLDEHAANSTMQVQIDGVGATNYVRPVISTQIKLLYSNYLLENKNEYIQQFLSSSLNYSYDGFELYELLSNNLRSYNKLTGCEKSLATLKDQCDDLEKDVWTLSAQTLSEKACCEDYNSVIATYKIHVSEFNQQTFSTLKRTLKEIKELIQDSFSLHTYSVQLSKIQINHFFHKCFGHLELQNLQGRPEFPPTNFRKLLKKCISTLFVFIRKPLLHRQFVKDCQSWIESCTSILLQIATIEDHLFILNHVLRCPPKIVSKWAASLVQIPAIEIPQEPSVYVLHSFGHLHLDYALTVLSTILNEIPKREIYLSQHTFSAKNPVIATSADSSQQWVVIDSDGEDDAEEDVTMFKEADLIALIHQIPFETVFKRILLTCHSNQRDIHDIRVCSEHSILRLISFSMHLVDILSCGFSTYCAERYKQLVKILGRLILHTVQYVADQLENSIECSLYSSEFMKNLSREYDSFVLRAMEVLNSARDIGTLQFLAALPYHLVSENMLWEMYRLLTKWDVLEQSILKNESITEDFEHELLATSEANAIYLLSTLSTMALSQKNSKIEFVRIVTLHLFQVGFLSAVTKDACSKHTRDLIGNLTRKFPQIISPLLHKIKSNLAVLDKMCLFLIADLAFELWQPFESDIVLLQHWLSNFQAHSLESQIARYIIQSMNWDYFGTNELFLPYSLHCRIAVTVASFHFKWIQNLGLTEAVKQISPWVTRSSDVNNWAWDVIKRFHVHVFDRLCNAAVDFDTLTRDLPSFEVTRDLEPLRRAVEQRNPIAYTVTLLMTPIGHLLPLIVSEGLELLESLVQIGKFDTVINILYYLFPIFVGSADTITSNEKFQRILKATFVADLSYMRMAKSLITNDFPGPTTKHFSNMIQTQLEQSFRFGVTEGALVELWVNVLSSVENWNNDNNVLYCLEVLASFAYSRPPVQDYLYSFFGSIYKDLPSTNSSGFTSMFFNWSSQATTVLPGMSYPQLTYIASLIFTVEMELENSTGFWKSLISYLSLPKYTLDTAVKKASSSAKFNTSVNYLSIFRWGQMVLDTPIEHPLYLILWQKFFLRYLQRTSIHESCRDGVGQRFFEGMINSAFLKKLKKRLHDALETYQARIDRLESCWLNDKGEGLDDNTEENLSLVLEYQKNYFSLASAMALWIEEEKFHKDSFYVAAQCPPQCLPGRLISLIEGDASRDWVEFIDMDFVLKEQRERMKSFLTILNRLQWIGLKSNSRFNVWQHDSINKLDEYIKRLNSYDKPLSPPVFKDFEKILPELNSALLFDKQLMLRELKQHFDILHEYTRVFMMQINQHAALDCSYVEQIPELYLLVENDALVNVSCSGGKKSAGCSGPARVLFEFTEAKLNERIGHIIQQNRSEYHDLIQNKSLLPPGNRICAAAVLIEDFITNLVLSYRSSSKENNDAGTILSVGSELFYFVIQQITEETNYYPPTRQLFSSFLEILGFEFIANRPAESKRIVSTCIQNPSVVGLLAPHINLVNCEIKSLIDIYQDIINVQKSESDLAFVLLSKLDLSSWLTKTRNSATVADRSEIISLIWKGLTADDFEARSDMVYGCYRNHFKIMLLYNFPQHFGQILKCLLEGSENQLMSVDVWYDVFDVLSRNTVHFRRGMEPFIKKKELKRFATEIDVLRQDEVMDLAKLLADHFTNARLSYGIYGLYPKYKMYLEPIALLLELVCFTLIASSLRNSMGLVSRKVEIVWPKIRDVYSPWILPYDEHIQQRCAQWIRQMNFESGSVLQPFVRNDTSSAMVFMSDFTDSVLFLAETLPGSPALFSNLWNFYVQNYAQSNVKDHVLTVVHESLISVPWTVFWPTFSDLELMNKVVQQYLPNCHSFLAVVFAQINWPDWISHFVSSNGNNYAALAKCHSYVLNIIVNLANDIVARESPTWVNVMETIQHLDWQYVSSSSLEPILNWFVMSIDPKIVLSLETTHHMDNASFTLLKIASGYSETVHEVLKQRTSSIIISREDLNRKRYLFVRSYIRLVISASSKYKSMVSSHVKCFERSIHCILSDINRIAKKENQDLEVFIVHLKEVMNLLSNHYLATLTRNSIIEWCEGLRAKVAAFLTAPLVEIAIEHAFKTESKETTWKNICDLIPGSFDHEDWANYVDIASKDGHYLLLNFLLLNKMNDLRIKGLPTITLLTDLLKNLKPREENEAKFPLLCKCFIKISLLLLSEKDNFPGGSMEKCVKKFLASFLCHLGSLADEKSWGLLGALGFNKSPQISFRGRLFCRSVQAFLQAQMPVSSSVSLRVLPDPSSHFFSTDSSVQSNVRHHPEVFSTIEKLEALKLERQFTDLIESIDAIVVLIKSPMTCLSNFDSFICDVSSRIYTENYLLPGSNDAISQCDSS